MTNTEEQIIAEFREKFTIVRFDGTCKYWKDYWDGHGRCKRLSRNKTYLTSDSKYKGRLRILDSREDR